MIILDRTSKQPLYIQIYKHIRDEIISDRLAEGHRLSATRVQAQALGVSRNTVEQAYLQLCAEGYLENRPGSGYYVRCIDPELAGAAPAGEKDKSFHWEKPEHKKYRYDMKYGNCDMKSFPFVKWKRAMDKALVNLEGKGLTAYGENCGDSKLRLYLSEYLERSRGVNCSPQQIILTSGTQLCLSLLCQLIRPECCAMEEPGYDGARYVFQNHGAEILPIPAGEKGLDLEQLKEHRPQAVYVTPSHQFPLGAVMPIQTRIELLNLAEKNGFYIIEDDYDSIFRYAGKAVPSLQGLDRTDRVIYIGSISKTLSPSFRLAYMVLPAELKTQYDMWFSRYHNSVPVFMQEALRIFMEDGDWDRHLRKVCLVNKRKHDVFAAELESGLGEEFRILGKGAGLHLLIESSALTAEEMLVRIEHNGVRVYGMEKYYFRGNARNLIMAGFGGISLEELPDAARRITEALNGYR